MVRFKQVKKGQLSGVSTLDGTGKIPVAQLPDAGSIDKIADITLGADTAKIDIINIPTNYKYFRLLLEVNCATTGTNQPLLITFNGVSFSAAYTTRYTIGGSPSSYNDTSAIYLVVGAASTSTQPAFTVLDISNPNNNYKLFTALTSCPSYATVLSTGWTNHSPLKNPITSMSIWIGDNIKAGSRVVLYGYK